jgi:ElaB/YqjD/DUF883 family membrane-anchored ribosome-binding protein
MLSQGIDHLFHASLPLQIIRIRNAHWVLPFLYSSFKSENTPTRSEPELIHLLAMELEAQTDSAEDQAEAKIEWGEGDESRARKYLLNWVQKRLLQDHPDPEGNTHYQLSAHSEKVFQWLQTLEQRQHVGTESRFKILFQTLKELVEKTGDDATTRLEELKNKKAEIEAEIKRLEYGQRPEVFSHTQVVERLQWFTRQAYELLGDFREVEDNFRQIHRGIVERHARADASKGTIVSQAFAAYDALRQSDQGRSFYAFYDFLISRQGQQEWRELTERLLQTIQTQEIPADTLLLQNIKSMLLRQGRVVYEANDKMAEKLSRIITEKELAKQRRLRQELGAIKEIVLALKDQPDLPVGFELEEPVEIKLAIERKLNLQPKVSVGSLPQPHAAMAVVEDPQRFAQLLQSKAIDRKKLWEGIEAVLARRETATLAEVIEVNGLQQGLAEVVTYFDFLRDKAGRVQTIAGAVERIPLNEAQTSFVEVPYLLFSQKA